MFTNNKLFEMILKHGYACLNYGKGLAHVGYMNRKMTKHVSKSLMKAIGTSSYDKIRNLLDIVGGLVKIKDQYQRERLEWIFGFGFLDW